VRLHHHGRNRSDARVLQVGVPAAIAGSIALALTSAPAQAAEGSHQRADRVDALHTAQDSAAPLRLRVPTASVPATYTVVRGDTISGIAARFGLRTQDVLALNGLGWKSVIHPGQVLRLTGAAAAKPAAPAAKPAAGQYTVVRGDTISGIAQRHGVSIQAVFSANGLGWASIIYPGQKLTIPGKAAAAPAAAAKPAAPAATPAAKPAAGQYTVVRGDTISGIAQRHGVSIQAVFSANGLGWASIIYPGQKLTIPGKAAAAPAPAAAPSVAGLDAEQIANARIIIQVGRQLGVPDKGIAIALGTAMQESWIRNLDWGDRDSLGLFQQRPSTGWGTASQVRDPYRAARAFYGGPSDPNGNRTRGLLDIPGWQNLTFAQAAQAVQISAYPDRYARWEKAAYGWLAALG
jgi:LysM repeat protein